MRLLTVFTVSALAFVATCAGIPTSATGHPAAQSKLSDTDLDVLEGTKPNSIPSYFEAIEKAIVYLDESQASSNTANPPDFTQAEKGLTQLAMLLYVTTQALDKSNVKLTPTEENKVVSVLLCVRHRIVTITTRIKAAKPFSDKYHYTGFLIDILNILIGQLYELEQALESKIDNKYAKVIPAIMVDIICVMSGTVDYLGGQAPLPIGYCSTYGGQHRHTLPEYDDCAKSPMPKPTHTHPGVQTCGSVPNAIKHGYTAQSWGTDSWCPSPPQDECPTSWKPDKLWWTTQSEKHT